MRRELVGHSKGKGDVYDTIYDQAAFNPVKVFDALKVAEFSLIPQKFVDTKHMKAAIGRHFKNA